MSEPEVVVPHESQGASSDLSQLSSGALLRLAREQAGMDMALLAAALKVPVRKLEALEADRFDLLPDLVFVRALASSVCRSLKIEPAPVLARLPHANLPHLRTYESGINVPFPAAGAGLLAALRGRLSKPVQWVLLTLLVGVLALWMFMLQTQTDAVGSGKSSQAVTVTSPVAAHPTLQPPPAAPDALLSQVAGSGATSGMVVFSASALAWVEVVDAAGVVQLRRNVAAGEVVGVSGALPLSVVVGRCDTTAVQVHGEPFDLMSIARDNVARFEVKQ